MEGLRCRLESTIAANNGEIARLIVNGSKIQNIDTSINADYLELYIDELMEKRKIIPFSIEEETSPTRWVIRAKK